MDRFQNILLVFNGSNLLDPATQRAMALARTNHASLTVVDVVNTNSFSSKLQMFSEKIELLHEQICEDRRQEIIELFHDYSQEIDIRIKVLSGKPFVEIIRYLLEHGCDLVIKTSEQEMRFSSVLFGSTDLRLLRKCPCPVWIVKTDYRARSKKILAAIDLEAFDEEKGLDQLNQQIIDIASSLSFHESSELNIVNAWIVFGEDLLERKLSNLYKEDVTSWMSEQKKIIESSQDRFLVLFKEYIARRGMEELVYNFHFIEGEAEDVILDLAAKEQVDLVVMGTVARTDLAGFFVGNTSEAILNQINCSVLAVKPSGFISPVTL